MALTQKEYEELRSNAIKYYGKVFKDKIAFDAAKVDDKTRLRLLQDPTYIMETHALKAKLFISQIDELDEAISTAKMNDDGKDHSASILKAIEMKQKILLDDININQDESAAMNITFIAMTKEEFENQDTIEINEGSNDGTELSSSFGQEAGETSKEDRMKQEVAEKIKALKEQEEDDGSN